MSARAIRLAQIERKLATRPSDAEPLRQLRDLYSGMTDEQYETRMAAQERYWAERETHAAQFRRQ